MAKVAGIVLAAGEGRRMGQPKAVLRRASGHSYAAAAAGVLQSAGCEPVIVVLGAAAQAAAKSVHGVQVTINDAWREGISTSLRAGLLAASTARQADEEIAGAIIHLVDLPDVGEPVIRRILAAAAGDSAGIRAGLVRACYQGQAGHPVFIGVDHWAGVLQSLQGDSGARGYLRANHPRLIEVSDLATGRDVDTPEDRLKFEAENPA